MKRLLGFIAALLVLGVVVPGCGGAHRYDSRLTVVDSLMRNYPDSALALLEALPTDSLSSEGDRAYRDLLLTQARYKAYIPATSDSDITRALAYYRAHPSDREKLTRAYLYKGAVMEELSYPDSAMFYYKQAEKNADKSDYFNLGYIKLRLGSLLHYYYAYDGKDIVYFEEALDLFNRLGDTDYQHICLNNLGCSLRESNPHRADSILNCALQIAKEKNDTNNILEDIHALIVLYDGNNKSTEALHLLNEVIQFEGEMDFSFCTTAANVYAHNERVDSAMIFLNLAERFCNLDDARDRMYFFESKAAVALAKGDTIAYWIYSSKEKHISDSLLSNSPKPKIIMAESDFEKNYSHNTRKWLSISLRFVLILIVAFVIYGMFVWYRKKRTELKYDRIINQLKTESVSQLSALDKLQSRFNELTINDIRSRKFIASQIEMLRQITVACYHEPKNKLAQHLKELIEYQDKNKHQWSQLYSYIDAEYNGIMTDIQKDFPHLNDKEILLVALSCLNFSYIQTAIILGYPNPTSIGTMKQRVANKMGLSVSLNEFIATRSRPQNNEE